MPFVHTVGKLFILSALSYFACYWMHHCIKTLGPFKVVYNHTPGPCRALDGVVHGSEDIQLLPNGIALITSGMRKVTGEYKKLFAERKGQIFAFDFKNPKKAPTALKLKGFDSSNFSPHGINIWTNKKGNTYVYVVSHPTATHDVVEKFLYVEKDATLLHQKSIMNIHFHVLNDLVVIGEDEFYATNFHYIHSELGAMLETFGLLKWGSIVYFDGKNSKYVARDLLMPNGINKSPDGRYIYVAHIYSQEVITYRILPNKDLEEVNTFCVHTNLDNLDVEPTTGNIWIGAIPIGYKAFSYIDNPVLNTAPSQVLRLKVKDGIPVSMIEVYADDGSMVSGCTVALHYKDAMLVGTIYSGLLYCDVKYIQP